ncbi:MAG: hypothetical protein KBT06_10680 [Prevotellaceae bacterium]|nr:hypothetical protein [Candidatus Colivivens equi]
MAKFNLEEFEATLTSKFKEVFMSGVAQGFRTAYDTVLKQIEMGLTPEQLAVWAKGQKINVDIIAEKEVEEIDKHE